jgi:hypothetical protein
MALPTSGPAGQSVFWIGSDGGLYYKNAANAWTVQKDTSPGASTPEGVQNLANMYNASGGWTQIADPNPPQQISAAPTGGSGGTGKVFNQAGAENTQRTIDQMPALLQAALAAEGTSYGNTVNGFNAAEGTQRKNYEGSTTTNQQNYDANFMDSIRAGIKGLGGLMQLLRGTGAAGGTAEDIARDTVGGVTSNDIRTGADTQKENQGQLDSTLSTFLTDLQLKRKQAEDTRVNNERAIRRDSNTNLQDLFGKMAGFYGDVGNTAASNDWMNRAGALTPEIAANSMTQVSPYDQTPVVVHAPNLTAFAPPTEPSVTTSPGQVGTGIFTMGDTRRKKDVAPTPVPVGV